MPSDGMKQRKTKTASSEGDEEKKDGQLQSQHKAASGRASSVDKRTIVSLLSLTASFVLAWIIVQQNARFKETEEKYKHLYEKAGDLLALEKKFSAVSEKLEASEDHLKGALSSFSRLSKLQHDITSLDSIITAMQEDQSLSSDRLQSANDRFLNVTETWQEGLATVTEDLSTLRSESRTVHGRVTERVNDAEEHLRALSQRLEELEDSSRRNGRVLDRTEEEDAKSVQNQLDWNTKQVTMLHEQLKLMSKKDVELEEKLVETEPRAKQCETQLPIVEDAVRSILRLGADLSGVERRIEELTLQVFGTEDSMLRVLAEILELQQTLGELQVDTSAKKVRNKLEDVLDAVKELNRVQRRLQMDYGTEGSERDKREVMDTVKMKQLNDWEKSGAPESAGDHRASTTTEEEPQ